MKTMKQLSLSSSVKILMLIIALVVVLAVPMLRSEEIFLPGTESYFNLRAASIDGWSDELGFGGRVLPYEPGLPLLLKFGFMAKVLPVITVLLSLLFLYLILYNKEYKELAVLIAAVSPLMLYLASILSTMSLALLFTLMGYYFLMKRNIWLKSFSMLLFALIPLFNFVIGFIVLIMLLLHVMFNKKQKAEWFSLGAIAAVIIIYVIYVLVLIGIPQLPGINLTPGLNAKLMVILSEFGSLAGLSLFALIVAAIGVLYNWKKKYRNTALFFSILLLVVIAFYRSEALALLNIFVSVFAAVGFYTLVNKGWESNMIKHYTLIVLACGLVFSGVMVADRISNEPPDKSIIMGMDALRGLPQGVVFSYYDRGHWISYADKKNVMDDKFRFSPNVAERWKDSSILINSRDIATAKKILDKYDIKYIWIDPYLKKKLWKNDEDGLLFLLKYSASSFEKVYSKGGVEIWQVIKTEEP